MAKHELVQELLVGGKFQYSTEKDGQYVSGSLSFNLEEATKFYNFIVESEGKELKKTLKSIEI